MSFFNNKQFVFLAVGASLTGYWLYKKTGAVLNAVNPMNRENVIRVGADATFKIITGVEIKDVLWDLSVHESDKQLWTLNRSRQLVKEAVLAGREVSADLMLETNKAAMIEWNKDHTSWWKVGDHWDDYYLKTGKLL